MLVRLPLHSVAIMRADGSGFRAVVVEGRADHQRVGHEATSTLSAGSYFSASDSAARVTCVSGSECLFYVRAAGRFVAALAE